MTAESQTTEPSDDELYDMGKRGGGRNRVELPIRLGSILRRWRLANDFGLEETAEKIGINYKCLYRLERGHQVDMPSTIKIISWLFGPDEAKS